MVAPMTRAGRLLFVIWLALFAVQASELIAAIAPDDCVEDVGGAADPCPDPCVRCVCCARVAPLVPPVVPSVSASPPEAIAVPSLIASATSAEPRRIFHVPRA